MSDANNEIRIISALYDKLYSILTYSPHPEIATNNPKSSYLHLCLPGITISSEEFKNLVTPKNVNGDLNTSFAFANLVNKIPTVHPIYSDSGNDVEKVYALIASANTTDATPDEKQEKRYQKAYDFLNKLKTVTANVKDEDGWDVYNDDGELEKHQISIHAPSPIFERYEKLQKNYELSIQNYRLEMIKLDLENPKSQRIWNAKSRLLQNNVDRAYDRLSSGGASAVRNALSVINHSKNQATSQILSKSVADFKKTELSSGEYTFHMTYPQVANWATMRDSMFTNLSITTKDMEKHSKNTKHHTQIGTAFGRLFGARGTDKREKTTQTSESKNIEINLKFAQITITRPWLNASLFSMMGWDFSNDIVISSGDSKNGLMPLLPTSFIITKDIKVTGEWDKEDHETFTRATSGGGNAYYGPFRLSGSHSSEETTDDFKSSFDGRTLTIPDTQIMGWISRVIPKCPLS